MNPLLLGGIFDIGKSLIDRFFPDPEKKAAAQLELLKMQQNGDLAQLAAATDLAKLQIQTNVEEAKSTNWFVAGWRPFVGWVCGLGLAYVALIEPLARFAAQVWFKYTGAFPVIDTSLTMQVLLGMLGLGAMRSLEKVKDAESKR
jgi:hypothetical protein